jgi:hypothetical protein
MTEPEKQLIDRLVKGRIPLELLLHIQESASHLDHGNIEIVFTGSDSPIDVVTKERKRFFS